MLELLHSPVAQAMVLITLVLIAATLAWTALQSYRNGADNDITPSDQLTVFREMRQRGELSETEFRGIKTTLGTKLREELKSDGHQN